MTYCIPVEVYVDNLPVDLNNTEFTDSDYERLSLGFERQNKDSLDIGKGLACNLFSKIFPNRHPVSSMSGLQLSQHRSFSRAKEYWAQMQLSNYSVEPWGKKVLDFGCGYGGSSVFLGRIGAEVLAIDNDLNKISSLERSLKSEVANVSAISMDGLEYMQHCDKNSFDLVTGFMLGWYNTDRNFIQDFYELAKKVVKPGGQIFVSSDLVTMKKVIDVFDSPSSLKYAPLGIVEEVKK